VGAASEKQVSFGFAQGSPFDSVWRQKRAEPRSGWHRWISGPAQQPGADMTHAAKKWSAKVTTDSTHPPQGLFNRDPETIASTLASKSVSPKGPGSGMRMLTFYINRAGKNLTATRRSKLEKAKELLSSKMRDAHEQESKQRKRAA
jgi:hypothetical protein